MTDAELLEKVKIGLFGTAQGTFRDELLTVYIAEVKQFMLDAGVPADTVNGEASVGCIMIGVNDIWNYSAGGTRLSEYFCQRVVQLAAGGGSSETT